MKRLFLLIALFATPVTANERTHYVDLWLDSNHWQKRPAFNMCPGPRFKSIDYTTEPIIDYSTNTRKDYILERDCVDLSSVIASPNDERGARFVRVTATSTETIYSSVYYLINCTTSQSDEDQMYWVTTNPKSDFLPPFEGLSYEAYNAKTGWFIASSDGVPWGVFGKTRRLSSRGKPKRQRVTSRDLYLCLGLTRPHFEGE